MNKNSNAKSKKILISIIILLIVIILIAIISLLGIKKYNQSNVEYSIKKFDDLYEYEQYIEDNVYFDKDNVIKIEYNRIPLGSIAFFSGTEFYINTKNNTIYKCNYMSGCETMNGTISNKKISEILIINVLLLRNEEIVEKKGSSYWTIEYRNKTIKVVDLPEQLKELFDEVDNN